MEHPNISERKHWREAIRKEFEEIFMKILEGLDIYKGCDFDEDTSLVLDKAIYGLVQAARQFHKD